MKEAGGKTRQNAGPLESIFDSSVARVLDQALVVGNMTQTVPMLVESTGLSFKTVQKAVKTLVGAGVVKGAGKVCNAEAYAFDMKKLRRLVTDATKYQFSRSD